MIYGAILGDVIGSRFEFDKPGWSKDFELLTNECTPTDDTVMTVAVANALTLLGKYPTEEEVKTAVINKMQDWGSVYPNAGYGAKFIYWLREKNPQPYGSFGNGSAMRTSAVGWLYGSLEKTLEVAKWVSEVSHDHPEGIKGAQCTSAVIYMARRGYTMEQIEHYIRKYYDYNIDETLESMRARHEHVETCMDSMPKALVSFLKSESYEDAVRNAVSLGGDTDTLAAITGAMAEAYYGVPEKLQIKCLDHLPSFIAGIVFSLENGNW